MLLLRCAVIVSNTLVLIEGTRTRYRKICSKAKKKEGTGS